jgi:hypothetical protein
MTPELLTQEQIATILLGLIRNGDAPAAAGEALGNRYQRAPLHAAKDAPRPQRAACERRSA